MPALNISPTPVLWIDDSSGNLGEINLNTGQTTVVGGLGEALTDIAFNPSQQLFGETFNTLYSINQSTGAATEIGNFGAGVLLNGLVFSQGGILYASGGTGLYTVNTVTAAATLVGNSGLDGGFVSEGDLAFVGGQLYESVSNGLTSDLARIDTTTGAGTLIGEVVNDAALFGLVTASNGVLYGIDGTNIYSINTTTGAGTLVQSCPGTSLGSANGAASQTESTVVSVNVVANITTVTSPGVSSLVSDLTISSNLIISRGTDTINAGGGSDLVFVSGASATVNGGTGNLTFVAGGGNYAGGGGSAVDILYGGAGSDTLTGGAGANSIIVAGTGNTSLVGGAGTATLMFGGTASSSFAGSAGGKDTMVGGAGANIYVMTNGDIAFGGPNGPDTYLAGTGTSLIVEGAGTSNIVLGGGTTTDFAGTGADTYTVNKGVGGSANIVGFKAGDSIVLSGGFTATDASKAITAATTGSFGTRLNLSDGTTINLFGATLTASQISSM